MEKYKKIATFVQWNKTYTYSSKGLKFLSLNLGHI